MTRAMKIKFLLLVALTALTVVLGVLYYRSLSQSNEPSPEMTRRWKELNSLPAPPAGLVLRQVTDGGCHPYGIDANIRLLVEITQMDRALSMETVSQRLNDFYAKTLQGWHVELANQGKSDQRRIIQGIPGLGVIEAKPFWYHDAIEKEYRGPFAEFILSRYTESDGLGRRFAEVDIVLCIRE